MRPSHPRRLSTLTPPSAHSCIRASTSISSPHARNPQRAESAIQPDGLRVGESALRRSGRGARESPRAGQRQTGCRTPATHRQRHRAWPRCRPPQPLGRRYALLRLNGQSDDRRPDCWVVTDGAITQPGLARCRRSSVARTDPPSGSLPLAQAAQARGLPSKSSWALAERERTGLFIEREASRSARAGSWKIIE